MRGREAEVSIGQVTWLCLPSEGGLAEANQASSQYQFKKEWHKKQGGVLEL